MISRERTIHASCVEVEGSGVLLLGDSGAGKTLLALELVKQGAKFVADDAVRLAFREGDAFAGPAKATAGLVCVDQNSAVRLRDVLPRAEFVAETRVRLCVELERQSYLDTYSELCSIPAAFIERADISFMAEKCRNFVNDLNS